MKKDTELIGKKTPKCINFDSLVLRKIEERAKSEGITVTKLVNEVMKQLVMTDEKFYKMMAKYHCSQMNHYRVMGGLE